MEADPAVSGDRDRGGRRPRRYISSGDDRKSSERFRTQPITSAERLESDRYSVPGSVLLKRIVDIENVLKACLFLKKCL